MYNILLRISNASSVEKRIAQRAKVILLAFDRQKNVEIGRVVGLERHCVGRWRRRWQESYEALLSIQLNEPCAALVRAIKDVLRDAHRCGAPWKFTAQQVVELVSVACEDPQLSGRPINTWTGRELADEMQKRNAVDSISVSRVNELLREMDLKPHRQKYWCFTTEKDHCVFEQQVKEVCATYLEAAEAYREQGTRTICVDEMTSLQANERRAQTRFSNPGQIGLRECQYNRHGTLSLTGSWDVVLGQMIGTTVGATRKGTDFAKHMEQTFATDPEANWVVVLDNLNTHHGEEVVRLVARLLGIDEDSLGNKKRRHGILGSVKSRRKFLTDPGHRIRFVFIPKHSSWLNQIETIFGVISRRVMRYGNFTSKQDLKQKLLSFVDYFNRTFAKPLNWTYHGKPTQSTKQRPKTWREITQHRKVERILALVA